MSPQVNLIVFLGNWRGKPLQKNFTKNKEVLYKNYKRKKGKGKKEKETKGKKTKESLARIAYHLLDLIGL